MAASGRFRTAGIKEADSARAEMEHKKAIDKSNEERRSISLLVQKIGFLRESAIDKTTRRIEELEALKAKSVLEVQKNILSNQIALHKADLELLRRSKPLQKNSRSKPSY